MVGADKALCIRSISKTGADGAAMTGMDVARIRLVGPEHSDGFSAEIPRSLTTIRLLSKAIGLDMEDLFSPRWCLLPVHCHESVHHRRCTSGHPSPFARGGARTEGT